MPYSLRKDTAACPVSKPWAITKTADRELMGCHATREDAAKQMAALNAQMSTEDHLQRMQQSKRGGR